MVDNVPQLKRRGFSVSLAQSRVHWQPAADVYRTKDGWLIKIELAGVSPSEVQIRASGSRLIIAGQRRDAFATTGCECHSLEIVYSNFERCFDFPESIERARFSTECRDGILAVRVTTPQPATQSTQQAGPCCGDTVTIPGDTVTIPGGSA
jgi:HSP20 family protein